MNDKFRLICVEGADKVGKTTLCNTILEYIPTLRYTHFTACNKQTYLPTDIPLQRNVSVVHQFYRFFDDTFYVYIDKYKLNQPHLLDRTLYSDIIYGPIYRGDNDELKVRQVEKNYFTMLLQGLGCIFIFADNSDIDGSYAEIVAESEGMIKSRDAYNDLRSTYKKVITDINQSSDLTWLHYDFNTIDRTEFVTNVLTNAINKPNIILDKLISNRCVGQLIGTTKITKDTQVFRVVGRRNGPITLQEYTDIVVDTGMENLAIDSPLMSTNQYCIVRKNSAADKIVTQHIASLK